MTAAAARGNPPSGAPRTRRRATVARRASSARRTSSAHRDPRRRPARSRGSPKAPARPKNAAQAKARAKARKAKAPKVVRLPLRERLLVKLSSIELDPRRFVTRVPFVVLVIGALGLGLAVTLWLSTDAAERSYQLGHVRETNQALLQQKEALERGVLEAQAAPALAEAARDLGMIPSRDTAHLVQDPSGNWIVVGTPKPAQGVPPPPLNSPLPEETPPAPPAPPAPRVVDPREVAVHLPPRAVVRSTQPGDSGPRRGAGRARCRGARCPRRHGPAGRARSVDPAQVPAPAPVDLPPVADTTHIAPQGATLPGPPPGIELPVAPVAGPQA